MNIPHTSKWPKRSNHLTCHHLTERIGDIKKHTCTSAMDYLKKIHAVPNICWLGASIWAVGAILTAGHPAIPETGVPVETVAMETGTVATLAVTVRITYKITSALTNIQAKLI